MTPTSSGAQDVTVAIPAYNAESFLRETLASVSRQTHPNLEILISDNGSTDGTQAIGEEAAGADARVRYVRHEQNRGMGWNFNILLELARGPFFMWLGADDMIESDYVSACLHQLKDPRTVLAFSDVTFVDAGGHTLGQTVTSHRFDDDDPARRVAAYLREECWDAVFGVARLEALRAAGGLPALTGDDVVLGTRLLLHDKFAHVPRPLLVRRMHERQDSAQFDQLTGAKSHHPDRSVRLSFPQWRLCWELLQTTVGADLPPRQRWACTRSVVTNWIRPKARRLAGDLRRNAELMRGSVTRART